MQFGACPAGSSTIGSIGSKGVVAHCRLCLLHGIITLDKTIDLLVEWNYVTPGPSFITTVTVHDTTQNAPEHIIPCKHDRLRGLLERMVAASMQPATSRASLTRLDVQVY